MTTEEPTRPAFPIEASDETLAPHAEPEPPAAQFEPPFPPPPIEATPAAPPRARRGVPVWVWILLVLGLVTLCCCCCALTGAGAWAVSGLSSSQTPGIGSPITAEGIQVQVTSVTRKSSYVSGTRTSTPSLPGDELMIIEAKVSRGDTQTFTNWKVYVTDENGRQGSPGITTTTSATGGSVDKVTWIIAVSKTSRAFTLHLPGEQTIDLTPLTR